MDPDVAAFLARLNLSDLTEIFENEEFDSDYSVNLSNEDLKEVEVRELKNRKLITQETQKMRRGSSRPAGPVTVKQIEKEPEVENSREKQKKLVVISSTGGAAQHQGGVLGQYEYDEDKGYYQQISTEQGQEYFEAIYLYPDKDDKWWVNDTPGEKGGWLHNPSPSKTPPTSGWQYGYVIKAHFIMTPA